MFCQEANTMDGTKELTIIMLNLYLIHLHLLSLHGNIK